MNLKSKITDTIKYMGSYQEVQIFDDGSVHIAVKYYYGPVYNKNV
ncbi:hypothetical protein [Neobacillus cucumis]|nr:hypothetical protein [Neobacillus cucumis]